MATTIDMLMAMDVPEPQTRTLRVPRLQMPDGQPLTITIKQLTYSQIAALREHTRDFAVHTVLAGVQSPSLRNKELLAKYGVETPVDLVKKLFLAGEIEEISTEISRLAGYHRRTVELVQDVKKN